MDELLALFHRAASIATSVADLAEREAERAARRGDSEAARARAIRTRRAAERGRRAARVIHVRHQARQLFDPPREWDAHLARGDESGAAPWHPALREPTAAVIGTDLDGIVRLWNGAAERLYGWTRPEALGRPISELTVGPEDARVAEQILGRVRAMGSWEGEFWVCRYDGTRMLAYVHDALVRDLDGRSVGIVGVSLDLDPGVLVQLEDVADSARSNVVPSPRSLR